MDELRDWLTERIRWWGPLATGFLFATGFFPLRDGYYRGAILYFGLALLAATLTYGYMLPQNDESPPQQPATRVLIAFLLFASGVTLMLVLQG